MMKKIFGAFAFTCSITSALFALALPMSAYADATTTLIATPSSGNAPLTVTFTGTTTASHSFDFGDGVLGPNMIVDCAVGHLDCGSFLMSFNQSHTYSKPGTYIAKVSGGSSSASATIVVGSTTPPATDPNIATLTALYTQLIQLLQQELAQLQTLMQNQTTPPASTPPPATTPPPSSITPPASSSGPTVNILVDKSVTYSNQPITVSWSSTGAASCDITHYSPDYGNEHICANGPNTCQTAGASVQYNTGGTSGDRTFTINCQNAAGVAATKTVHYTVNPAPTVNISVSGTQFHNGQSLVVSWNSNGATSCDVTHYSPDYGTTDICVNGANSCQTSNSLTYTNIGGTPGPRSFTITCTNNGGASATQTATYQIN